MSEPVSVELTIPSQADLVILARLTAATVASRAGFGVEDIEDVRLAVEELCLSLAGTVDDGRLHLSFEYEPGAISVDCWFDRAEGSGESEHDEAHELSLQILDALVDEHGRETADGRARGWMRKRATHSMA